MILSLSPEFHAAMLRATILAAGGEVRIERRHRTEAEAAGLRLAIDYDPQTGALTLRTEKEEDHDDGHSGASGAQPR